MLAGYGVGRLSHTLVRGSARAHLVVLALVTAAHQAWATAFELGGPAGWPTLFSRVLLATVATAPLGTLLLLVARRVGGHTSFGHAAFPSGSQS